MTIKFYNVLTRKKEVFRPLSKQRVGLYTCGPTVYNFVHIGNLRTYLFEDMLKRVLLYSGYRVRHVMNITDVDDKIIRDASKQRKDIREFTAPYEKVFYDDLQKLNIIPAWKYPRATEHIKEMVRIIQRLLKKGIAYSADGSIYFGISKFKPYGKLSRVGHRELKAGASAGSGSVSGRRVEADEYTKQDVQDFALWKAAKPGEPSWPAKFGLPVSAKASTFAEASADKSAGEGRPGWHIECSAMSMKYLGETFDIHAGGVDLIFPHHENEIAQSEGATGHLFARFFIEGEHLLVNGEKMSKSLGNVFSLRDLEARGIDALAFRYLVLTSHYRSKLNFTWESLEASGQTMEKLYDVTRSILEAKKRKKIAEKGAVNKSLEAIRSKFEQAITDDLNTPKALAVLWSLIRDYNRKPEYYDAREVLKLLYGFDAVLGLGLKDVESHQIPDPILQIANAREEYRQSKEWAKADELREKLRAAGYAVEDTPEGPRVRQIR